MAGGATVGAHGGRERLDELDKRENQAAKGRFLGSTYLSALSKVFAAHLLSAGIAISGPFEGVRIIDEAAPVMSHAGATTPDVCQAFAEHTLKKHGVLMTDEQIAHHQIMWAKATERRLTSEPVVLELIAEAAYLILAGRAKALLGKESGEELKGEIDAVSHGLMSFESAMLARCIVGRGGLHIDTQEPRIANGCLRGAP